MLQEQELDRIEDEFERIFGENPQSIHLIGSHAAGTATADSDVDIYLETNLPLGQLTNSRLQDLSF